MSSSMSLSMPNMSVMVADAMDRCISNLAQDVAMNAVRWCASHYKFDAEEASRLLGLNDTKVTRMSKSMSSKRAKSIPKSKFVLPYSEEHDEGCCSGLRQNHGLYTQCQVAKKGSEMFCKSCQGSADKNNGVPEYGTIEQRKATGVFEYVDPKGRKPTSYAKVMKKLKISEEEVLEEAGKLNIIIDKRHFEEEVVVKEGKRGRPKVEKPPKEPKGAKGRPKKSKKVVEVNCIEEDLFASLVADANAEQEVEEQVEEQEEQVEEQVAKPAKKGKKDEAERLKEKEEKEAERKAAKEAKKKAEEEAKEAKKKAEEEAKALKKKAEEEAKALKKQMENESKKEKKEKAPKKEKKETAPTKTKTPPSQHADDEEEQPDVVKKIEVDGKKYLKSKNTGIIYDYEEYTKNEEQVVVGKWNDAKNKIDFKHADEEEEEEEYNDEE